MDLSYMTYVIVSQNKVILIYW